MNYFVRHVNDYHRDLDVLNAYYRDMATGLARATGKPYEFCLDYVKRTTGQGGRLEMSDPPMKFVGRNQHGDRVVKVSSFLQYLNAVQSNALIMSPSMTVYQNPKVRRSVTSQYIAGNVKKRGISKKEMFQAKENNNAELAEFKNNEQKTHKIKNNALSGAHCSDSTVLYIDTIHSSLTSTCRSAAGYGNANNEKVLSGNRHYWSPDVVSANILAVINHVDFQALEEAVDRYGIRHPSVEDTMECIQYSSDLYWRNPKRMAIIQRLVEGLSPIERSAFVYTGDMYHLAKHNPELVRTMLERLSHVATPSLRVTSSASDYPANEDDDGLSLYMTESAPADSDSPKQYLDGLTEEMEAMVSLLCGKYMDGKSLGQFDRFSPEVQNIIGQTARSLKESLDEYALLIKVILVSDVMPASMAHLPSIVRRSAITSDTDSTIYTVQDWLKWYSGKVSFEEKTVNIGHAISFLASASITHILAKMSANMGVDKKQLHQYAMKSEYYFPVFSLTSRAKTYFAFMGAQEGQVFTKPDLELKGAVLKGSNSPKFIVDGVKDLIVEILDTVRQDKKIRLYDVLNRVADIEKRIFKSIESGDVDFYKTGEIKPADSYKKGPSESPYFHYLLWENVFAEKYGHVDEPPYGVIKVSIDANSKTDFTNWLMSFDDVELRERLIKFLKDHNKNAITTINVPRPISDVSGVPKEIIQGVSARKMVSNLMEPYYVVLESLGYYALDGNQLRLVSDYYAA